MNPLYFPDSLITTDDWTPWDSDEAIQHDIETGNVPPLEPFSFAGKVRELPERMATMPTLLEAIANNTEVA